MNYQDTITYLFNSAPLFQNVGGKAYKEGLDNTLALDHHFGHPHRRFRSIHVAGTNGKGSCSHLLAAVLQRCGLRVGLYTSPHLVDFRERIRVDGQPIGRDFVVDFVERERAFFEPLHPSFFELTTAMAFLYFAQQGVDVAVVEVGLGGRLDCTNILSPDLCLITNISLDHTAFLGHTLAEIAAEKAGIIKTGIPVVIGEANMQTRPVFMAKAQAVEAPIVFAEEVDALPHLRGQIHCQLQGIYQEKNIRTTLTAIEILRKRGYIIPDGPVVDGFAHVCELTGLMGRWQRVGERPTVVCDTGHNVGGMTYIARQLRQQACRRLRIVVGMASDKDVRGVLALLPPEASYYFTQASVRRALPAEELMRMAKEVGLSGLAYPDVKSAFLSARRDSQPDDFIFVGGSSFVVADLLTFLQG